MPTQEVTTVSLDSIAKFHAWLFVRGKSANTLKAYSTDLRMFLKATSTEDQSVVLQEEFEELAMGWLTMNRNKVAQKTTNRRLTSLRSFAKWAGWGPTLVEYDAPQVPTSMPHPLPEGIDGVRRLIAAASSERHIALVTLCGMIGCRVGEAIKVMPTDFDLQNMSLAIHGKGEKVRHVPVSMEARRYLEVPMIHAFANGTSLVVMHDRNARKVITTLGRKAGLKRAISSHDLRATFGTEVYNKTKDIRLVQTLLGHANSSTTEIYIGVKQEQLREAVEL